MSVQAGTSQRFQSDELEERKQNMKMKFVSILAKSCIRPRKAQYFNNKTHRFLVCNDAKLTTAIRNRGSIQYELQLLNQLQAMAQLTIL